jgi:hypothetical protein
MNNILRSFKESDMLEKGVYADTPENRKKGRVGQSYGLSDEEREERKKKYNKELAEKPHTLEQVSEKIQERDDEHAGTPHAYEHIKTSKTKDLQERHKKHSAEVEQLMKVGDHKGAQRASSIASRYGEELVKRGKGPK